MEQTLIDEHREREAQHYGRMRQQEIDRKVEQPFNILNFQPYFDHNGRRFSQGNGLDDGDHGEGYDGTQQGAALLVELGGPEGGNRTLGEGGPRAIDTLAGALIVDPRKQGQIRARTRVPMMPAAHYEGFRGQGGAKVPTGTVAQYRIFQEQHPGYPPPKNVFL
jgi:hypothetical protein